MDVLLLEKLSKDTFVLALPLTVPLHVEIQKGPQLNNVMTGISFPMMVALTVLKTMDIIVLEQNLIFARAFAEMG